jgi:hypothetical protein
MWHQHFFCGLKAISNIIIYNSEAIFNPDPDPDPEPKIKGHSRRALENNLPE